MAVLVLAGCLQAAFVNNVEVFQTVALNFSIQVNNPALAFSPSLSLSLYNTLVFSLQKKYGHTQSTIASQKLVQCARFDPFHSVSPPPVSPSLPLPLSPSRMCFCSLPAIYAELFTVFREYPKEQLKLSYCSTLKALP